MPKRIRTWLNMIEEYISGRDLTAEMQVDLGSGSSLMKSLVDLDLEKESNLLRTSRSN